MKNKLMQINLKSTANKNLLLISIASINLLLFLLAKPFEPPSIGDFERKKTHRIMASRWLFIKLN
ncbi:hypothetical protein [Fictibacillus sp. NRS-1165]|uniref:hypothetical protein n=1 Tax=Fictibacillus sp. NRS-1165 TaxID=3144463 RepID=UPI003D230C81